MDPIFDFHIVLDMWTEIYIIAVLLTIRVIQVINSEIIYAKYKKADQRYIALMGKEHIS